MMIEEGARLDLTKASLLSRVRDPTDQQAWRDFEGTYRELVLRYCAAKGLQPADREDVFQRLMLKLMKSLPGFTYDPARGRFRDYLFRSVRSAICDHVARPKPASGAVYEDVNQIDQVAEGGERGSLDDMWNEEWTAHHYRLAMVSLRETFDGKSVEMFERLLAGGSVEMVAKEFATTSAAVHKAKQRIRDRLAELIAEQIRAEDHI